MGAAVWRDTFSASCRVGIPGLLSWHTTGRALDLALEYKVDGVDQMPLVREDLGENVYWRLYLRTALQDGTLGEPLKDKPWLYWWRIVPDAEPEAYDAGGKRLPVPAGYYADVTAIAKVHGWVRLAYYAIEGTITGRPTAPAPGIGTTSGPAA